MKAEIAETKRLTMEGKQEEAVVLATQKRREEQEPVVREKLLRCKGLRAMQATALYCTSASNVNALKRRPKLRAAVFLSVVKAVVRGPIQEI